MLSLKAIALILIILGATATTSVAYVINPQPFEVAKWQALNMVGLATTTTYYVCTYVTPNTSGGTFTITETLGVTQIVGDGGRAAVKTDGTVYYISPYTMPSGYKFQSWSSQRSVSIASASSSTTTVTFGASGWDGWCLGGLAINLVPSTSTYAFTVSAGSGGTVSGKPSGSYAAGTAISVTATASGIGYTFSSWSISGASCSGGASANPCSFSMPSNAVSLTANFSPVVPPPACQNVNTGEGAKIRDPTGKVYIIQGGQKHWIRTENILNILGMALNLCYGGWANVQDVSQACANSIPTGSDATDCTPPPPLYYSLAVSAGSGGTISGTPSGSYAAGASISVTANPSSGYWFSGWSISSASCSGGLSANPCSFSMPSNSVSLTANFAGGVTPQISASPTTVTQGGSVTFTGTGFTPNGRIDTCIAGLCTTPGYASASGGFSFPMGVGTNIPTGSQPAWAADISSGKNSNTVYITVNPLGPPLYTLSVSAGSGGTVSGTASGSYAAGASLSISANPSTNYRFSTWSVSGASCAAGSSNSPCSFSMPSNAVSVTANFMYVPPDSYSLTVSAGSGGTVSGTTSGSYAAGASVSVTATPSSSYSFSGWSISGASCSGGTTSNPCSFSMPANTVTLTANFAPSGTKYYVCTYVNPNNLGTNAGFTITGAGTFYDGQRVQIVIGQTYTITANPVPTGYIFSSWSTSRGVHIASTSQSSTTVYFDSNTWDGNCVGGLSVTYGPPPPPDCDHTLPWTVYDSGKWEWRIEDLEACKRYKQYQSDVDAFRQYPDMISAWLTNNLGQMENFPAKALLKLTPPGGAIYAAGTEIGIPVDAFYGDYQGIHSGYAYVLIAHETMNLYTGHAVSGGWPYDWWADGRSPFPLTTGMKACIDLHWQQSAAICQIHLNNYAQSDSLVAMFQSLYMGYGNGMFSRTFSAAKSDGINWDNIGANPSALRTNYVTAYLTIGAGGDLTSVFSGKVPNFDPTVTMNIKQARTNLQSVARSDSRWTEYLHGNYVPALVGTTIVANFAYKSAGQPDWTSASQGDSIKVVSPTEFKVTIIQGQVYGVRVVVDGSPYTMTTSGSNIYLATLNLSSASHVIRFEYQSSSGGSWGPLGLLDTQSQETGLAGIFATFVALVLDNWLVSSGLMLVLLASAIVIVWRRRR